MAQNQFEKIVSKEFENHDTQVKAAQALAYLKELGASNGQVLTIGVMMSQTSKEVIKQEMKKAQNKKKK